MKTNQTVRAALLALSLIPAFAIAGEKAGNGGFAFTAAIQTLKFAQRDLLDSLNQMDPRCINQRLTRIGLKPIDLKEVIGVIRDTRRDFTKTVLGTDENGDEQPLIFTYGIDEHGPYIEALAPYFFAFMNDRNGGRYAEVEILLLHEASHIFGYSEKEATRFSRVLAGLRSNTTGDDGPGCWSS